MKKETKAIISISTRINPLEQEFVLDDICHAYNSYKRSFFANTCSTNPLSEKDFRNKHKKMDRRYSRSVEEDINGLKDSIQENRKNYIQDQKVDIISLEKNINKTIFKLNNGVKNGLINKEDEKIEKKFILSKYRKLKRLKFKLRKLENDFKNKKFSLCFGTKKLFKKQFRHSVNHVDFLEEWRFERNNSFRLTGAKHETCGNNNIQLRLLKHNLYTLKIRVPLCLEEKYGKYISLNNVSFPNKKNDIIQEIVLNNQSSDISKRKAISYMFKKDKKGYRLILQVQPKAVKIETNDIYGVIGVDLNDDNFSLSEIDNLGNLIKTKIIRFNLKNKSSNQREDIINLTMNKVVDYAYSKKKDLIYEDLDFKEKKRQLTDNKNKEYARMLSSFAYAQMTKQLKSRAFKKGVRVEKIDPAYTSLIGRLKYAKKHGISVHQAASYVIARKYYGLEEKIEKKITIHYKGKTYKLRTPARMFNARGNVVYNKLYKWFDSEMKASSRWIPVARKRPILNPTGMLSKSQVLQRE